MDEHSARGATLAEGLKDQMERMKRLKAAPDWIDYSKLHPIKIGILGVGWWGTVGHLQPLSEDPKAEVVAVWSRTEEKARGRAEQYNVPRYYTDYRALIDTCELDGVIVASTPSPEMPWSRTPSSAASTTPGSGLSTRPLPPWIRNTSSTR